MNELEKYLNLDYSELPPHLRTEVQDYIEKGNLPGVLLQALISNNLFELFRYTGRYSLSTLATLVFFFQAHAPEDSWGSPEAMELWKARRGIRG